MGPGEKWSAQAPYEGTEVKKFQNHAQVKEGLGFCWKL